MKVCSPDRLVVEVDGVSGRRYNMRKGIADVSKRDAKALVRAGGFIPSMAGTTSRSVGYRCTDCGFGSFFVKCGRCGGHAEPEGPGVLKLESVNPLEPWPN